MVAGGKNGGQSRKNGDCVVSVDAAVGYIGGCR